VPQFLRGVQHHSGLRTGMLETINAAAFTVGCSWSLMMKKVGLRTLLRSEPPSSDGNAPLEHSPHNPIFPMRRCISADAHRLRRRLEIGPLHLINSQDPTTLLGESMSFTVPTPAGGTWGIAILAILVDRQRSFWSSRLGESLNHFSLATQDALHDGAAAFAAAGLPIRRQTRRIACSMPAVGAVCREHLRGHLPYQAALACSIASRASLSSRPSTHACTVGSCRL